MKEKIEQLEAELMQEKDWQMRGEIDAKKRPENSLLETVLDYDTAMRVRFKCSFSRFLLSSLSTFLIRF